MAEESAPVTPAPTPAPAAAEAAPAPAAPDRPSAVGIVARMTGQAETIRGLEASLTDERAAHAATRDALAAANARVAELAELESLLAEAESVSAQTTAAVVVERQTLATAQAAIPAQVATGVRDAVATLGVSEEKLPEATSQQPGPGQEGEFAHLKGVEKAAAAFNAQFAN